MSSPHSSELSHDLDPRIQEELEKLNKASNDINKLELELEGVRGTFRQVLTGSTQQLNALSKSLGSCIDKARPYYDARLAAKEAQQETQNAALRFERACGQLTAAKEMVTLAEEGFFNRDGQEFDPAWQEMLNHATMKVSDAERERLESEWAHENTATAFNEAELLVKELYKEYKRSIVKSKPYFELKARFTQTMQEQKSRVSSLEKAIQLAKQNYSQTLRSLECISDEIHQQRQEAMIRKEMGERSSGVGEETPPEVKESPQCALEESNPSKMSGSHEIKDEKNTSADRASNDLAKSEPLTVKEQPNEECTQTKPVVLRASVPERRNSYERAIEEGASEDLSSMERTNRLRLGFRRKQVSLDSSKPLQHPSFSRSLKGKIWDSGQTENIHSQRSDSVRNTQKKTVQRTQSDFQPKQDIVDKFAEPRFSKAYSENVGQKCQNDMNKKIEPKNCSPQSNSVASTKPKTVFDKLSSLISSKTGDSAGSNKQIETKSPTVQPLIKETESTSEKSLIVDETIVEGNKDINSSQEPNKTAEKTTITSFVGKVFRASPSKNSVKTNSLEKKPNKSSLPEKDDLDKIYNLKDLSNVKGSRLPSMCMTSKEEVLPSFENVILPSSENERVCVEAYEEKETNINLSKYSANTPASSERNSSHEDIITRTSQDNESFKQLETPTISSQGVIVKGETSVENALEPLSGSNEERQQSETMNTSSSQCSEERSLPSIKSSFEATEATMETNSEIMESIQEAKGRDMQALRPNLAVEEEFSDSASMASGNLLDDDQVEQALADFPDCSDVSYCDSAMTNDYGTGDVKLRHHDNDDYRRLPARLSYLQEYVTGGALLGDSNQKAKNDVGGGASYGDNSRIAENDVAIGTLEGNNEHLAVESVCNKGPLEDNEGVTDVTTDANRDGGLNDSNSDSMDDTLVIE